MKKTALVLAALVAFAPLAKAQTTDDTATQSATHSANHSTDHSGHMMADNAATKAYRDANMAMHQAMDIEFTGNADVDFVAGMIAHHQGAIDMAKVVLEHGTDPEIRKLAEDIIAAQEGEIAFMRDWLAKNGQ